MNKNRPDCYKCKYRGDLAGDAHSCCNNNKAKVKGDSYGIRSGWFFHPFNFDPTWLEECDGFEPIESSPTERIKE
jgi:hypothetical protein